MSARIPYLIEVECRYGGWHEVDEVQAVTEEDAIQQSRLWRTELASRDVTGPTLPTIRARPKP